MDMAKLILTEPALPPASLEKMKNADSASEAQKKQFAKNFESVFISKLLDEMKNTIGDWGFEKDEDARQTEGIFWLFLARDMANNGGFGMWKDIYQSLTTSEQENITTETLDKNI